MTIQSRLNFKPVLDSLCGTDWFPLKMSGMLRQWLIAHFVDPANIVLRPPTGAETWVWNENDNTGLLIEDVARWAPRTTDKRPSLIIKRHEAQAVHRGVGADMMQGSNTRGETLYSVAMAGSTSVFAIAAESGECEYLAAETYQELLKFAPIVRQKLNLLRVAVLGVGELNKLDDEARENFVVPVTVSYAFWHSWAVTPNDTALLNRLDVNLTSP